MKKWTVATVIAQLRVRIKDEYGEDILNDEADVLAEPLGMVLERLKAVSFRESMVHIDGQLAITDDGKVVEEDSQGRPKKPVTETEGEA